MPSRADSSSRRALWYISDSVAPPPPPAPPLTSPPLTSPRLERERVDKMKQRIVIEILTNAHNPSIQRNVGGAVASPYFAGWMHGCLHDMLSSLHNGGGAGGGGAVLVSKVKVTTEPRVEGGEASASGCKYGASEYLIEEEEGLNDHNVVPKCAEIQTAISEADMSQILD
ncbi:hypothetical protein ZWY2020_037372 [Hordeum vulgare]|nr:hypothetical protein ZWY2020_037372 [Hordeum vulgare]